MSAHVHTEGRKEERDGEERSFSSWPGCLADGRRSGPSACKDQTRTFFGSVGASVLTPVLRFNLPLAQKGWFRSAPAAAALAVAHDSANATR